jgi:hypothetical protein
MISMVYLNGSHEVEVFGHWIRSSPMHSYRYRQIRLEICSPYDRARGVNFQNGSKMETSFALSQHPGLMNTCYNSM